MKTGGSQRTLLAAILLAAAGILGAQTSDSTPPPGEAAGFSGGGLHLFPLGWSSEGRWGCMIGRREEDRNTLRIMVIDAVTDELLYESEDFPWTGAGDLTEFWDRKNALVLEVSESFDLELNRRTDVRDASFTTGGYAYTFALKPPSPAAGAYTLSITSSRGDGKTVYSGSADTAPGLSVLLGVMVSPFEERALAVIRETEPGPGGRSAYRFSGAHLTLGFRFTAGSGTPEAGVPRGNLLSAVYNGLEYLVKSRLDAGADPDIRDDRGYPAVLIAARLGHWNMVVDLLDAGADPDPRDASGRSALHHAAFAGHQDAVRALLAAGADRNVRDGAGRTPAELAADATVRSLLR